MVAKSVDYNKMKLDFFSWEEWNFTTRYRARFGKEPPWWVKKQTVWRTKEKEVWLKWVTELALQRTQVVASKAIEIPKEKLQQMKKTWLELLIKRLNDFMPKKDKDWKVIDDWATVNVKDIRDIINLVKVELWEPTSISKDDTPREPDQISITINSPVPINITWKRSWNK